MSDDATVAATATIKPFNDRLKDTDYAVEPFNRWELLTYLVWIPLMLVLARFGYQLLLRIHKGSNINLREELIEKDNKAVCISFAGYVFAVGLCTYGALSNHNQDSATNMWQSFVWSLIGFVYINVSEFINDRLLHWKINYLDEVVDKANIAVGCVHASVYVSTGIIVRFIIAGDVNEWGWALLSTVILWAVTQVFFIAVVHLYDLVTPGVDIQNELLEDNRAVGVSVAGGILSFAVLVQSPIAKSESVVALAIWCGIGLVLMVIFKYLSNTLLIRNVLLVTPKNLPCWAASLVEAAFMMAFAMALGNFITNFRCGTDPRPWTDRITDIDFAMSIFRWYNLAFIGCILAMIVIARLVSQFYDLYLAIRFKASLWTTLKRFLRSRRRDEAKMAAYQVSSDPYLRSKHTESELVRVQSGVAEDPSAPDLTGEQSAIVEDENAKEVYSIARCIEFAGYLVGIAFVMRGALGASVNPGSHVGDVIGYFFLWSAIGLIGLALGFLLVRFVLWRHLFEEGRENPAVGILAFGAYVASGMIMGSCLGGMSFADATSNSDNQDYNWGEDIATVAIFFGIGQGLLLITGFIFQYITTYNDINEVKKRNAAVGLTGCLNWISFGICASAPVFNNDSVLNVFLFYIIAVILLQILRLLTSFVIVGGGRLDKEIAGDQNWGASLVEGACAITTALCLTTFMADSCALNGVKSVGY